jgi:hypothetical protein
VLTGFVETPPGIRAKLMTAQTANQEDQIEALNLVFFPNAKFD